MEFVVIIIMDWTGILMKRSVYWNSHVRSFPTLDEIFGRRYTFYSEKKGRSSTEDKSSTRTSGVDTVDIGKWELSSQ